MISKGSIDLINQLMPHCNESALLFCIRALHDLLSNVNSFPSAIFDNAVNAATDVFALVDNPDFTPEAVKTMWQYVGSVIFTCSKHEYCKKRTLVENICRCMPKILQSSDPLTQFYGIASAGNIFFNNLCYLCNNPVERIKTLLKIPFMEFGILLRKLSLSVCYEWSPRARGDRTQYCMGILIPLLAQQPRRIRST